MAMDAKLRQRINKLAEELLRDLYGAKGYPAWGTKFIEIEEQTGEVGDALACAMLSHSLRKQAEEAGHQEGAIPFCVAGFPCFLGRSKGVGSR